MLYTKIFSPKYRSYLRGITYSVFFAFLLSLTSCYTVSEETINTKELYIKDNYTILEARLKNDSVINLQKYQVACYPDPQEVKDSLESNATDSIVGYTPGMITGINVNYDPIPDIKVGTLKCVKTDTVIATYKGRKEYRFNKTYKEMQYDSISSLKLRIDDTDASMTVLAVGGLVLGTLLFIGMLIIGQDLKGGYGNKWGW